MNSSDIVRTLLERKGWTQGQLSRALGYSSPGTMSNKLRRGNMTMDTFLSILDAVGYEMVLRPKVVPEDDIVVGGDKEQ